MLENCEKAYNTYVLRIKSVTDWCLLNIFEILKYLSKLNICFCFNISITASLREIIILNLNLIKIICNLSLNVIFKKILILKNFLKINLLHC